MDYFNSIGMPICLNDLKVEISDDDLRALSKDATMNDTVKLTRIRPLDAEAVYKIYKNAILS